MLASHACQPETLLSARPEEASKEDPDRMRTTNNMKLELKHGVASELFSLGLVEQEVYELIVVDISVLIAVDALHQGSQLPRHKIRVHFL